MAIPCPAPVEFRERSLETRDGWYCRACNHNHGNTRPTSICGASVSDEMGNQSICENATFAWKQFMGGQLLDCLYGEWIDMWEEITKMHEADALAQRKEAARIATEPKTAKPLLLIKERGE